MSVVIVESWLDLATDPSFTKEYQQMKSQVHETSLIRGE
jgi:hypothetical protein